MATRRVEGWLLDVDDLGPEVALWVYTSEGRPVRLTQEFRPPVFVQGERAGLRSLAYELERRGILSHVRWVERREFWSGKAIEVLELAVSDSSLMPKLRRLAASRDREYTFYNCDIPVAQYYLYLKGLFPLCNLSCDADAAGNVLDIAATGSASDTGYELPALKTMRMWGEHMRPLSDRSRIVMECGGEQVSLRPAEGARVIELFNSFIKRHDPDLILSERGDSVLIPALLRLAKRAKLDLMMDRDRVITKRKIVTEGRTYFSYGRVIYKGPAYPMFGRWHIDARNSFIYSETGLEGLVELARQAKVPVQRMARTSPGSAMTSMQIDQAVADGILVPWRKSEPESYKTALDLLRVDKGGLVFQPPVGAFERVAEIDFASMYPAIMVRHNISPETVLCACCENAVVPEAGYNVCEKRRGLIPRTLEPLLEQRKRYKRLMRESASREEREKYDSRQTAIKWMLVSCFGYLGYRNARFGRIEAHEAVTAFGREKLLRAKEVAEGRGFRVLHAITDSLWIKREVATWRDLADLCSEITRVCEVEMSIEGVYRWIVFLPSKENEGRPVPARYYGVFTDGTMKMRGLACRRDDTPEFIRRAQLDMLTVLAGARTLAEREKAEEEADRILAERIGQLERREVDRGSLIIRRTVTKDPEDRRAETRTATAARQLRQAGIAVHPGERVRYIVRDARAKEKQARVRAAELNAGEDYDVAEYVKMLKDAASEVIR